MPKKPRAGKRARIDAPWADWIRVAAWQSAYWRSGDSPSAQRVVAFFRKRRVRSALIKYIHEHEDLRPAIVAAHSAGDAAMYAFLDTIIPSLPKSLRRHRRKQGLNHGTQEATQANQD